MKNYEMIKGADFKDERGGLRFFNDFEMLGIKRFYEISPANTEVIRAWQGHHNEQKWFYCSAGSFIVNLVKIENFENPPQDIIPERLVLISEDPMVLHVPGGYATGIKASQSGSRLTVFSDVSLKDSGADDHRYPTTYWEGSW